MVWNCDGIKNTVCFLRSANISLHAICRRRQKPSVLDAALVCAFTRGWIPPYAFSLAPEALSRLLLRGHGTGIQMCHEPQSRSPQCCCQLPSSPLFLTDTLLMLEARTVIKDVCTLKCCQAYVDNWLQSSMCTRHSLSANTKALLHETAGKNFFRFISVDVCARSTL